MTDTYRVRDLEWREAFDGGAVGSGWDSTYMVSRTPDNKYTVTSVISGIFRGLNRHFDTLSAAKEAANEHNRQRIAERYLEVVR